MSTTFSKRQWAKDFLAYLHNSNPSPSTIAFVQAWEEMESGSSDTSPAAYNPLNTTQHMPGSTDFNSAHVQNFTSYQDGIAANATVLENGLYPTLLLALQEDNPSLLSQPSVAGDLTVWVSGNRSPVDTSYVNGILSLMPLLEGGQMSLILTSKGSVLNLLAGSQFEPNETEFACGFYASAVLKFAAPANQTNPHTWEDVDRFADQEYSAVYGNAGAGQSGGISIDELHTVFAHAGNLHYWDITAISPGSTQSTDIAAIKAALSAGYPVVATIVEASVNDLTGDIPAGNPYEWNPVCNQSSCPTHVLIWCGVASDGNLLAWDYANVVGPLQGSNSVRAQPRKYDIGSIDNQFATVVQVVGPDASNPWLKPIPSADPTKWPAGFDGQNFQNTPPPAPGGSAQQKQFAAIWNSSAGLFGGPLDYTTGIAKEWQTKYMVKYFVGPPITREMTKDPVTGDPITDWDGNQIIMQLFSNGMCQDNAGKKRWWLSDKEITF